jgi:single-stranded-DNA-specific exonuclease
MYPENIELISNKFEEIVSSSIDPSLLIPEIVIDAEIDFKNITWGFFKILKQMEPYGPENPRPVFITRNITDTSWTKIVKDLHIRFVLKKEEISMTGIGFNLAEKFQLFQEKKPIDIVYTIDENEWNGETTLQLKVIDFRLSESGSN